jgi:hypothetical protein
MRLSYGVEKGVGFTVDSGIGVGAGQGRRLSRWLRWRLWGRRARQLRRRLGRRRWPQVGTGVRARDGPKVDRVSEDVGCGVGTLKDRDVEKRGGGTAATAASAAA